MPGGSVTVRRTLLFAGPLLGYGVALIHPGHLTIEGNASTFMWVHLAWVPVICLLAWMIVQLVDGAPGLAATAARALAVPFAVVYATYTAFGGLMPGVLAREANRLPQARHADAAALIGAGTNSSLARPLYITAAALWIAAVLAAALALRGRAPLPALVLIVGGAIAFGVNHVQPWGPGGLAAVLAGVVWIELRRGGHPAAQSASEPKGTPT